MPHPDRTGLLALARLPNAQGLLVVPLCALVIPQRLQRSAKAVVSLARLSVVFTERPLGDRQRPFRQGLGLLVLPPPLQVPGCPIQQSACLLAREAQSLGMGARGKHMGEELLAGRPVPESGWLLAGLEDRSVVPNGRPDGSCRLGRCRSGLPAGPAGQLRPPAPAPAVPARPVGRWRTPLPTRPRQIGRSGRQVTIPPRCAWQLWWPSASHERSHDQAPCPRPAGPPRSRTP